jgi:hypothetical protein
MAKSSFNPHAPLAQLLQSESLIRVLIDDAGNFGNQAASYNLMKRIRKMGFTGIFEIIYFEQAKNKILQLFNLPERVENIFISKADRARFIDLIAFSKIVKLALCPQ